MNLDEIKELIALMRKNKIQEIDLEREGSKVRIVAAPPKGRPAPQNAMMPVMEPPPAYYIAPPPPPPPAPVGEAPKVTQSDSTPESGEGSESAASVGEIEVKSPMVGTFYRAPTPDAPPYVELGSVINPDSVLCVVEAMKLLNEIKSETRGKILKILVENGQPVEFNQPLFLVEPF